MKEYLNFLNENIQNIDLLFKGTELKIIENIKTKIDDINVQNKNGETLLHYAVYYTKNNVIKYLLKNGANPFLQTTILKATPIFYSILREKYLFNLESIKLIIDKYPDVVNVTNKYNQTFLYRVLVTEYVPLDSELVNYLIKRTDLTIKSYNEKDIFHINNNISKKLIEIYPEEYQRYLIEKSARNFNI